MADAVLSTLHVLSHSKSQTRKVTHAKPDSSVVENLESKRKLILELHAEGPRAALRRS